MLDDLGPNGKRHKRLNGRRSERSLVNVIFWRRGLNTYRRKLNGK